MTRWWEDDPDLHISNKDLVLVVMRKVINLPSVSYVTVNLVPKKGSAYFGMNIAFKWWGDLLVVHSVGH
jgi:hypothetical protein